MYHFKNRTDILFNRMTSMRYLKSILKHYTQEGILFNFLTFLYPFGIIFEMFYIFTPEKV